MGYDCHSSYGDSIGGSGEITFIATASGTHSETVTYTDPGISYEYYDSVANEWVYMTGIWNNSLVFGAELNVQGVPLDDEHLRALRDGRGALMDQYSQLYEVSNILKNTDVDRERLLLPRPRQQVSCVELHRQLPPLRRRYHNAC